MPALLAKSRGLLLPLLLIGGWEYLSRQDAAGAYAFVPLSTIGQALLELLGNGELLVNLLASLARTSTGLALGIVLGVALGVLMALSSVANRLKCHCASVTDAGLAGALIVTLTSSLIGRSR